VLVLAKKNITGVREIFRGVWFSDVRTQATHKDDGSTEFRVSTYSGKRHERL
jgi:hypothetical protein